MPTEGKVIPNDHDAVRIRVAISQWDFDEALKLRPGDHFEIKHNNLIYAEVKHITVSEDSAVVISIFPQEDR